MRYQTPRPLSAAQHFQILSSAPLSSGYRHLGRGQLTWCWQASPSPLGRLYDLRVEFTEGRCPKVFVDGPNLVQLADGRRPPHIYDATTSSTQLCLYLPGSGEWHSGLHLAKTVVPWASVWLYFFEEWLASGEWKGGGKHPANDDTGESINASQSSARGRRQNSNRTAA